MICTWSTDVTDCTLVPFIRWYASVSTSGITSLLTFPIPLHFRFHLLVFLKRASHSFFFLYSETVTWRYLITILSFGDFYQPFINYAYLSISATWMLMLNNTITVLLMLPISKATIWENVNFFNVPTRGLWKVSNRSRNVAQNPPKHHTAAWKVSKHTSWVINTNWNWSLTVLSEHIVTQTRAQNAHSSDVHVRDLDCIYYVTFPRMESNAFACVCTSVAKVSGRCRETVQEQYLQPRNNEGEAALP